MNLLLALLCWKFRDADDPSAESEHILGCCGQRTRSSLLENFENHPLSFLCFHKCPENRVWKPLKNTSSRECLMFSKPAVIFIHAKTTQQVCPELTNVFSCPQKDHILWQITALPVNKHDFTELWWRRYRMGRGPGKSGSLEGKELCVWVFRC